MDVMDWSPGVVVCYKVGEDFFGEEIRNETLFQIQEGV